MGYGGILCSHSEARVNGSSTFNICLPMSSRWSVDEDGTWELMWEVSMGQDQKWHKALLHPELRHLAPGNCKVSWTRGLAMGSGS